MQQFEFIKIKFISSSPDCDIYECFYDGSKFRVSVFLADGVVVNHNISFSDSLSRSLTICVRKYFVDFILRLYANDCDTWGNWT